MNELENRRNHLSTTCKTAHSTQRGIDYLDYTTETTTKFIEAVYDKYALYLKEKSNSKVRQRLQCTIKLAEHKIKELEKNIQEDNNPEVILKEQSKRKSFHESLPHSRVNGNS